MKIALAQINTTVADFEGTVGKVKDFVERAKKAGAALVAFPELTVTGYPPRDLVEAPRFIEQNLQALAEIARLSVGIDIVIGYVEKNDHPGGKPLYNAAAFCRNGKIQEKYFKNLLPTYDVFDEGRYFEPGSSLPLWTVGDRTLGPSICEDSWNDKAFWEKRLYARDPIDEEVKAGANLLLNISASPFSLGKPRLRRDMLRALSRKHKVPLFYVNLVGGNDELVFDGRSLAINAAGEIVAEAKAYEEDLLVIDLAEMNAGQVPKIDDLESVFKILVLGLRDYVRKCGFTKVVLGLSGGVDSTLVAVIAAEALGAANVLGVIMPSPYSSEGSRNDARVLVKNLGIEVQDYPIAAVYESYRDLFGRRGEEPDLADENVQARIRGNILMTLSNRHGHLVLSTGNKSEIAVGYCTLYGDMSGGMAVISDVPKTMVYDLARHYQVRRPVIPPDVFTKPPSAELRPDQTDQDSLPPYDVLDRILRAYVEENKSEEEMIRDGLDEKTVRDVVCRIKRNEYKRRQAAPGIKITSKAFGIGRRYPIARKI